MKQKTLSFYEAINYLYDSRKYIYAVVILFFVSASIGFIFSERFSFFEKLISELILKTEGLSGWSLILFIFKNNLSSAFFGLVFGLIFGVFPLFNIALNGLLIGFVVAKVSEISSFYEIWRLFPHGIFELPAIFISLGLGLRLGFSLFNKKNWGKVWNNLLISLEIFVLVVIPLLAIAAVIEGGIMAYETGNKPAELNVCFSDNCFKAEVALTEQEQTKGLSMRESLLLNESMLFVFNESGNHEFWMKEMKFNLDLVWMNKTREVVFVYKNASVCSENCEILSPNVSSKYVLELNSGVVDSFGIKIGERAEFRFGK